MSPRLDLQMVERGLVPTRAKAQALIMAGVVSIDNRRALKAGESVPPDADIRIAEPPRFVSRGGEKLDHALTRFAIDLDGKICADIGASTGGFTDVMLQRGAGRVYAIDVGYGQLAIELRNDSRVVVMDRTNARYLEALDQSVEFTAIDASFISLSKLFPAARRISSPDAQLVTLVKPQFEAGRSDVGKRGVVRDPVVHARVLAAIARSAEAEGLKLEALTASPIKGPAGNVEFLAHFIVSPGELLVEELQVMIDRALVEAPA